MRHGQRRTRGDRRARHDRAKHVAAVLRRHEAGASPFQYEAAATHGLRAALCLRGWHWQDAHDEARSLVKLALDLMGARRPSWEMGQREYALRDYAFTERTRCIRCGGEIPETRRLYCGELCKQAHNADRAFYRDRDNGRAMEAAAEISWSK